VTGPSTRGGRAEFWDIAAEERANVQALRDARQAEHAASRKYESAARWKKFLGVTLPEQWDLPGFDQASITLDGVTFSEHHEYRESQHRYWLTVDGSDVKVEYPWQLADALEDRETRRSAPPKRRGWWLLRPAGKAGDRNG
jgi:hypothetical protein